MNSFWTLTAFEYQKIFRRKSVVIALALALLASVISAWGTLLGDVYIDGVPVESNYEAMQKDRAYARALAGRAVDETLLLEASAAYATIPQEAPTYQATAEYQTNARPYSEIYGISRLFRYESSEGFGARSFASLTADQAKGFYPMRREIIAQQVNETQMSGKAKAAVLEMDAKIRNPWIFSYSDGYGRFYAIMYTTGIIAAFVAAVCIAPLFAGEYTSGACQLILSSKHGKGWGVKAKIFTGFSLAALLSIFFTAQTYVQCMLTFGPDGASAPIQLHLSTCVYPITVGQAALLQSICILFACLMVAAVTMALSSKLKTPFGVIILVSLLLIVPMLLNIPEHPLLPYLLYLLLPANMMTFWNVFEMYQYELFGLTIPPFAMMPLFSAILAAILCPIAIRIFKNHQIQ